MKHRQHPKMMHKASGYVWYQMEIQEERTIIQKLGGEVRQKIKVLASCRQGLCLAQWFELAPVQQAHVKAGGVRGRYIGPSLSTAVLPL